MSTSTVMRRIRLGGFVLILAAVLVFWRFARSEERALFIPAATGDCDNAHERMQYLAQHDREKFLQETNRLGFHLTGHQICANQGIVFAIRSYNAPLRTSLSSSQAMFSKMTVFAKMAEVSKGQVIRVPEDADAFYSFGSVTRARRLQWSASVPMYWGKSGTVVIETVSRDSVTASFDLILQAPQRYSEAGGTPTKSFQLNATVFRTTSIESLSPWEGGFTEDPRKAASPIPWTLRFLDY